MRLRLTKLDEFQFLTCLKHQIWGSKSARFKDWKAGDYLVIIVDKSIAGLAEVSGEPYVSGERVWDNDVYPHRIPMKFIYAFLPESRLPILGEIRSVLTSAWGTKYGWGILNQQILRDNYGETLIKYIHSQHNDLKEIQNNLEHYLIDAKRQRDIVAKIKRKSGRTKKADLQKQNIEKTPDLEEESAHSKAQSVLIKLGRITGCSVWIASNDRNRQYDGKSLGEGCLKSLPNFRLDEEATSRISLIDAIWIQQNAPVCAFEIETTTSIYSGLLRMSDLLTLVPILKIKLFIVAPRKRQDQVLRELARPTFRKIGLNEYCRFLPTEDLDLLLEKVEDLDGHVQPSILDTIAVELDEDVESAMD